MPSSLTAEMDRQSASGEGVELEVWKRQPTRCCIAVTAAAVAAAVEVEVALAGFYATVFIPRLTLPLVFPLASEAQQLAPLHRWQPSEKSE